jgi:hypothetical protein
VSICLAYTGSLACLTSRVDGAAQALSIREFDQTLSSAPKPKTRLHGWRRALSAICVVSSTALKSSLGARLVTTGCPPKCSNLFLFLLAVSSKEALVQSFDGLAGGNTRLYTRREKFILPHTTTNLFLAEASG